MSPEFALGRELADLADALEAQYERLDPHSPARGVAAVTLELVDTLAEALDQEEFLDAAVASFLAVEGHLRHPRDGHPADCAREAAARLIRASVDLGRQFGQSPLTTAMGVARMLSGYCELVVAQPPAPAA